MVTHSSDVENGLFVHDVQQGRNLVMVGGSGRFERCYDAYDSGTGSDSHDLYGLSGGGMGHDQYNCITSTGSYLYYCDFCWECSFCLGCVGLRGKSYCILNKQYSPDEWYALADRIFAVMETEGTLGAFFPGRANPFYFNDTMAYLMSPGFSREEILADSYLWRDHEISVDLPEGATATDIRDIDVTEYDESILDRIIRDGHGDCYRVVRMEYDFLRRHGLPLPREHWLRRIKRGFEFA